MLALVGLLREWRPFGIGFLLGCAAATSPKTAVLLIALSGAAVLLRFFRGALWSARWLEAVLGFAIVPGALAIYFAAAGAMDELVYCLFTFNDTVALLREHLWIGRAIFPFTAAALA